MAKSNIAWTEHTWNPIVGCSIVSPGCTNCYATQMAARIEAMNRSHYDGTTKQVNGRAVWTGKLALAPEHILRAPLKRRTPTTYFVNSMGDLFHDDMPQTWIDQVFAIMACAPQHTFQVLTKRAERMRRYLRGDWQFRRSTMYFRGLSRHCDAGQVINGALPNVWLGISAERQEEWDERKDALRHTPAAVRFASFEPLLGPIVEPRPLSDFLQWAIVGGESGRRHRPIDLDWVRSIRDQCEAAGVPMFFKQWGGANPKSRGCDLDGRQHKDMPRATRERVNA